MITRLDHVQLAMPPGEEAKARAFFAGLLGMTEEEKPEPLASRGGCWFRGGSVILHLGVEKEFTPQKKAHPAFTASDIERSAARLKESGYPVIWDEALPGRRRFYTADPFGNRIELMREGDGFGQK
jgi:catechol 2,3-dioxygenase-like lactoylglutathione lyase family enzyme